MIRTGEKAWVQRILQGSASDERAFVLRYYPFLRQFLRHLTGNPEETQDLVQQTFLEAWKSLPSYRGESSLSTWLHRIAYRQYLRWVRSRNPTYPLQVEVEDPHSKMDQEAIFLRCAMTQLTSEHREVLVLYYSQGLSTKEVAQVLDIPAGTVKSRLFAARQELRKLWNDRPPDRLQKEADFHENA